MMNLNFMTCNTESKPRQGKSHTITMTMTNKFTITLFRQTLSFGCKLQLLAQFEEHIDKNQGKSAYNSNITNSNKLSSKMYQFLPFIS